MIIKQWKIFEDWPKLFQKKSYEDWCLLCMQIIWLGELGFMVLYFTSAQFQSKHVCCVPLNHKTEYVHDLVEPQTYSVLSCSIWITEFCLSCCVFYFVITTPFLPSWQVKMQQIFLLFTKRNYCSKYFICCSKLPASENKLVPLFTVAFKTDRSGCRQFMLSSSLQETSVCYFISKVCSSG